MYTLMEMLAKMAYAFGVEGAGSPSLWGSYEMAVPETPTVEDEDRT